MKTPFIFVLALITLQLLTSASQAQQTLESRTYTVSNGYDYWTDWNWPRYLGGYDAKPGNELSPLGLIRKLGGKEVRNPLARFSSSPITPEFLTKFKAWEGYCDAVSEASVLFSEPVDVEGSIGRISAHQIKGMVAYYLTMRRLSSGFLNPTHLGHGTFASKRKNTSSTPNSTLSPSEFISFVDKQMNGSDRPVIVNFRTPPMIGNSVLVSYQQSFEKTSESVSKLIFTFKYLPELDAPCLGSCKGPEVLLDGEFVANIYFSENGQIRDEKWTSEAKPFFAWVPDSYDIFRDEKIPVQIRDVFKKSFNYNSANLIANDRLK